MLFSGIPTIDTRNEQVDFSLPISVPWGTTVCATGIDGLPFDLTGSTIEAGLLDTVGAEILSFSMAVDMTTSCISLSLTGTEIEALGLGWYYWYLRVELSGETEYTYWVGGRWNVHRVYTYGPRRDLPNPDVVDVVVGSEIIASVNVCAVAGGGGGGDLLAVNNLSDVDNAAASLANIGGATAAQGALADTALQTVDVPADITATGTPGTTTFLRGDGAWAAPAGTSGDLLAANNLSDVDDAATSRTNLGLGTAATTSASDYATAAQGALADTALQDASAFATAAQGALADTATQPGDLGTLAAKDAIDVPADITATGTPSSTTFLRGDGAWADTGSLPDGTALAPSLTFTSDPDTGMYRAGTNEIGFTAGGVELLSVGSADVDVVTGHLNVFSNTGSDTISLGEYSGGSNLAAIETSSFYALMGTGNGNDAAYIRTKGTGPLILGASHGSDLTIATGGAVTLSSDLTVGGDVIASDGSATAPSLTFASDGDTGMYRVGANQIGFSAGGVELLSVGTDDVDVITGHLNMISNTGAQTMSLGEWSAGFDYAAVETPSMVVLMGNASDVNSQGFIRTKGTGSLGLGTNNSTDLTITNGGQVALTAGYGFTTASSANLFLDANTKIYRSTSAAKYKTDVETMADEYADAILDLRPVWYKSLGQHDPSDWGYWGLIAEEVAAVDPRLVHYGVPESYEPATGAEGELLDPTVADLTEPEGVQYERFVPHLINLVSRQRADIEALEARLAALES